MSRPTAAVRRSRLVVTVVAAPHSRGLTRGLRGWLVGAAPARAAGRVAVALVPDWRMQELNARFRGMGRATDVLSFPADAGDTQTAWLAGCRPKTLNIRYLGDIAIATGVARRQALMYGHSPVTEVRVLALHGLLHLLGYDHERDQGQMQRLEARLRRRAHLPAGLLSRAPGQRPRR